MSLGVYCGFAYQLQTNAFSWMKTTKQNSMLLC